MRQRRSPATPPSWRVQAIATHAVQPTPDPTLVLPAPRARVLCRNPCLLALALSTTRRQPLQLLRPRQRQPTRCFSTSPPPRRRVSASLPLLRHGRARCCVPRAGASLARSALPRCEAPEATAKEDDQAMTVYPQGSPCNFPIRCSLLQGQENQGPTPVGWSGSDCAGHIADRIQHVRCERRQLRRQHMPWATK